jgi:hypothetical protein
MKHAAAVRLLPRISQRLERTGQFLSHYLEMVVVMLLGMLVLGGPLSALLLSDHADALMHAPVHAYTLATLSMVVPMVGWMRYRGHGWRPVAEMSSVMILAVAAPLAIVQLAATAGLPWPTRHSLPSMTHLGLFGMAALMLYRCNDYCHASTGGQYCTALFSASLRARRAWTAGNEHGDGSGFGVVGTLLCWGLVLALVVWGTLSANAYH